MEILRGGITIDILDALVAIDALDGALAVMDAVHLETLMRQLSDGPQSINLASAILVWKRHSQSRVQKAGNHTDTGMRYGCGRRSGGGVEHSAREMFCRCCARRGPSGHKDSCLLPARWTML